MAIVRAVKSGNWSDTTVWNTGALPTSADDVYSNTFTVTINVSPTVLSISNAAATGVTIGGTFIPTNGITVVCTSANGVSANTTGAVAAITSSLASGQSFTLQSNCTGGSGSGNAALSHSGAGTVNIIGNCTGGNNGGGSPSYAALNTGLGAINVTGNANGGGNNGVAVSNNAGGTINITGNVTGGSGVSISCEGVANASSGTVSVTGTVTGGTGALTFSAGARNSSAGLINVVGTCQASSSSPAVSNTSVTGSLILSGPFLTSANGVNPVYAARWFWQNTTPPATYYQIRSANLAVIRPLYTADSVGGNPATSNVRSGTVYGPAGELTGTCAVPPAGSVALGVPVDNTTGTAAITAATIRSAVGLASANLDAQLAAIPTTAAPNATAIASQVRTELSTELGRIDTTVSSRLAPGGTLARVTLTDTVTTLTNAPDVPTEGEIADAVRTELTPELARMANAATTQEVGDIVEGALD